MLISLFVTPKTYRFMLSGQCALSALSGFKLLRSSSLICTWSSSFSVITRKLISGLYWCPLCFSVNRDAKWVFYNAATVTASPAHKLSGINLKWPSSFFNLLIKSSQDNVSKSSKGHDIHIERCAVLCLLTPIWHEKQAPHIQMDACKISCSTEGIACFCPAYWFCCCVCLRDPFWTILRLSQQTTSQNFSS